jgi:hypothetical protein
VSSDLPVEPGIEAAPVQGAAPQGVFPVLAKDGCAAGSRRFPLEAMMTTDRELLEPAAKAYGLTDAVFHGPIEGMWSESLDEYFNPLTDDGDAFRLAVKLGFFVDIERPCGVVDVGPGRAREEFQYDDLDAAYAATRRAIVRAAAEIGRTS